jgi:hypothetical protein
MSADDRGSTEALCAQWMPRKKTNRKYRICSYGLTQE